MTGCESGNEPSIPAQQPMSSQPAPAPPEPSAMATEPGETSSPPPPSLAETSAPTQPREHAPPLGTRIEVLWKITHDEGGVEERWWGAVVQDCTRCVVGSLFPEHSDKKIYILLYDAYGEFEEDVSRVAFLPDGVLLDVSQAEDENRGLLDWRREGEPSSLPAQLSLDDVVEANAADLAEAGVADDADLHYLARMPAHVQSHMTSGYRVFADGVREMLSELSAKHPGGYVVTESDVREMCARIKR